MTIQEMYQELEEQTKEDIKYNIDYELYDDSYIIDIDYTTQEQSIVKLDCASLVTGTVTVLEVDPSLNLPPVQRVAAAKSSGLRTV